MAKKIGFVWHERYMWHNTGMAAGSMPAGGFLEPDIHIENPAAKRRMRNLLDVTGVLDHLTTIKPRAATEEEVLRIHTPDYIERVKAMSALGFGDGGELAPIGKDSWEIALLSAGGCIEAADKVWTRELDQAYALVRPPGHHAERDRGRGFCLLANVPIAIEHLRKTYGVTRIATVDWDVHHGNGAQAIYYDDPGVLTISLHQDRNYPRDSGAIGERGAGAGFGANINIPLPPGSGHGAYLAAFDRVVLPALAQYKPEMIIVPSGFDGCAMDPLGRQMLVTETYREMTARMVQAANALCGGRLMFSHEGGYSPAYAPWCGLAVMETLAELPATPDPFVHFASMGGQELQPWQSAILDEVAALIPEIPG
ncbi:class II histone deacetylase [Acidisoma silvae]|uniref:Class II histone deacetylase n=1 Tax=Acidisoma silvae TaxID=2802396 RepID=A0A964E063_9PROT|nr:class II histone deacetylase [Acidisoma silvae]MCB8876378.1 class II histone deacetylase [Acidisoma silvae]